MSNKQAFLRFVKEMTSGLMGAEWESTTLANREEAKKIAEVDPHLGALIEATVEPRLEVLRYLKSRAEHGTR